ncbi:AMP-binding protein [Streptomyces chartreusis]|uniref:AMP-binding protein n=1 Tax=Streptomyces chartreusis TaxID=1969 RepID=UPI0036256AA2
MSGPNVPEFTIAYYGILKAGATVVPLNVLLKEQEVAYQLTDSEAKLHIAFEGTEQMPIGATARAAFQAAERCTDLFVIDTDASSRSAEKNPESFSNSLAGQPETFDTVPRDDEDTAVILYTGRFPVDRRVLQPGAAPLDDRRHHAAPGEDPLPPTAGPRGIKRKCRHLRGHFIARDGAWRART